MAMRSPLGLYMNKRTRGGSVGILHFVGFHKDKSNWLTRRGEIVEGSM